MNLVPEFLKSAFFGPKRSPADDPVSAMRGAWLANNFFASPVNYENSFKAQYALYHPAIFRCVDKIAAAVQETKLIARKIPKEEGIGFTTKDRTTKALQELLDNPNDTFNSLQMKYWLALNLSLYGNIFVKIGRGSALQPNAIYPLQTPQTSLVYNKRGLVVAYRVKDNNKNEYVDIPTRQVVEGNSETNTSGQAWGANIFRPSQDVLKNNNAPLHAATAAADIVSLLLQRAKDTASGMPNIRHIVSTDASTTVEQENSIIELFKNAMPDGGKSGQVGFISGSKVTVTKIDNGMTDIHTKLPSDDMVRQIGAIFGVPLALLGLSSVDSGKVAGNYIESRLAFIEDTIVPSYLRPIELGLTTAICPPGYEIAFDLDSIQALQDERINKMMKLKDVPFITDDEKRMMCGFSAKPQPNHGTLPPTPSNFVQPTAANSPGATNNTV